MKTLILITFLIFSLKEAFADKYNTFELSSSVLTHHYSMLNADRFVNKVSADGRTINNPLYAMTFSWADDRDSYGSFSLYGGEDSIGSEMGGFLFTAGLGDIKGGGIHLGAIWGMYFYDEDAWEEKFHDRLSQTPSWLYAYYGDQYRGMNMVFGLELNAQVQISEGFYFKIRNAITPVIWNTSVGLGWNY